MQSLNSCSSGNPRPLEKLCNGQALLYRSLNLKVTDWSQHTFDSDQFYTEDVYSAPETIIQTTRLGIPLGEMNLYPIALSTMVLLKIAVKTC